ncbi:DNA recombination protein RmuC [Candidatus Gracilibacteria bacterium]|nr:DNA recombination protein RmuC [Candidatus Gracilibacteria bacterium]
MTIDIFFLLLSLSAILLVAILIILIIVLTKLGKNSGSDAKFLQNSFEHLRQSLDFKLSENGKRLSENFATNSRISENASKHIEHLTRKLTELGETNKEIQEIGKRLEGLEHILKNPKRRGNLGEYFLKELLENVFHENQYTLQASLSSGIVDALLHIGPTSIPIDAKFPQENYDKLIKSEDEFSIKKYSGDLRRDIKLRIDEVAKYILPAEGTSEFAFMLIPAEGLYYDIFIGKIGEISSRELVEYGFSKKVIITSPSGFYAYLQTVLQGMKSLQIEEHAKEIQKYVLKLQKDLQSYEETFLKLGNSLGTTVNHYNTSAKRLQIVEKDILRINPESEKILAGSEEIERPYIS